MTITIGHDRVPRVFWGADAPGAEVWLGSETSTSLDPDGCVVRRHDAAATESTEDTGAFETANESADAMPHTSAKKTQKVCKGGGLPLDKEPSNGCLMSWLFLAFDTAGEFEGDCNLVSCTAFMD